MLGFFSVSNQFLYYITFIYLIFLFLSNFLKCMNFPKIQNFSQICESFSTSWTFFQISWTSPNSLNFFLVFFANTLVNFFQIHELFHYICNFFWQTCNFFQIQDLFFNFVNIFSDYWFSISRKRAFFTFFICIWVIFQKKIFFFQNMLVLWKLVKISKNARSFKFCSKNKYSYFNKLYVNSKENPCVFING